MIVVKNTILNWYPNNDKVYFIDFISHKYLNIIILDDKGENSEVELAKLVKLSSIIFFW